MPKIYEVMRQEKIKDQQLLKKLGRIKWELLDRPTGFDILMRSKKEILEKILFLFSEYPDVKLSMMADVLEISERTLSRHVADLIKQGRLKEGFRTSKQQIAAKKVRKERMKAILFMVPKITRKKLAEELGISQDTLDTYIKEARRDGEL